MFPTTFADEIVERYTRKGDVVLDPFAGRGTAIFSAGVSGRHGIGIEISPVGWVYSQTKLAPAAYQAVAGRLVHLSKSAHRYHKRAIKLPVFFHCCYSPRVLEFLVAARDLLDWRNSRIDRTAMAFLLINLHGKRDDSLSNQMRQTKSMSPRYAVRWWHQRRMRPPDVDPLEFVLQRMAWRYAKGLPDIERSRVYLGDSVKLLPRIPHYWAGRYGRVRLLLTSPPYYKVTNYHYDQWLRLWLLGGPPSSRRVGGTHRGKFEHKERYRQLLLDVFTEAKALLTRDATVYVRADKRRATLDTVVQVLADIFPERQVRRKIRPYTGPTQTKLFGHAEPRLGEVDIILES
jgi:hypothetical protein